MKSLKRPYSIFILLGLLACAGQNEQTGSSIVHPETAKSISNELAPAPDITIGTLENGIKYYIKKNAKPEKRAELRLVVNAGSILEEDDQLGLAHFVEHMAFNGTEKFAKQELIDYLELIGTRFGADLNASTSFDETIYKLRVPTDSLEILEQAFEILEQWAHAVSFDSLEIEKERGVVIEEWRTGRGANARMMDKQLPIILKDSHYADRLPIGSKESLETFPRDRLVQFYKDWYRPDLMAVIAVGDFDKTHIEALIKEHFNGVQNPAKERPRPSYPIPDHKEKLYAIATDPEAAQTLIQVIYKHSVRPEGTEEEYRNGIVDRLYNTMLNNRFGEIVQKPNPPLIIAQSMYGNLLRTKDMYAFVALVAEDKLTTGLEGLLTEAERIKQYGFTETELEREKTNLLRGMENAWQEREKTNSGAYAAEYIRNFLGGEPIPGIDAEYEMYKKFLPGITVEEVNQLAQQWITEENRVVTVNAPEKEGIVIPTEAAFNAVFDAVKGQNIEPYIDEVAGIGLMTAPPEAGRIVITRKNKELDIAEMRLGNGIRVFLKPTDFKEDEVLFSAYSPGGTSLISDRDYIAGSTAATVVENGGLGELDQIQLEKILAGKVVSVSPYINELEEGLSGSASPKDLETLFQLIYLTFTAPREDSIAFVAYKQRLQEYIANMKASPESALQDTLQVTLANYHLRAQPVDEAYFAKMDLQTSFDFYKNRFADAGDFSFFFVGNFDLKIMKPLIKTYLASLPALDRKESWKDVGMRSPKGVIQKVVRKGKEPKSQTSIVFTGPFEWSRQARYNLQAMVNVLSIMLRERVREDLGGTYGVGVNASYSDKPDTSYSIRIGFGCDPERAEELTAAIFEEINDLIVNGPSEKNLFKVQETQRREYEVSLKQNRSWLTWLEFYDEHGEEANEIFNYPNIVDNLNAATVQETAKKYLNLKNYVQVRLMPEE
ncbi:MAG: insulinase family protein [Deferribacteres bacterium]|nr:insulinase family protein [candidate division KSB1 bacterium]MCB9502190.1 insulinase family protein [Deferribacteres bacterium]